MTGEIGLLVSENIIPVGNGYVMIDPEEGTTGVDIGIQFFQVFVTRNIRKIHMQAGNIGIRMDLKGRSHQRVPVKEVHLPCTVQKAHDKGEGTPLRYKAASFKTRGRSLHR